MKKTIFYTSALVIAVGSLTFQSCNNEKKETDKTDTMVMKTTDTMKMDSVVKVTDSTDTGGRAGQAPPAVKKER